MEVIKTPNISDLNYSLLFLKMTRANPNMNIVNILISLYIPLLFCTEEYTDKFYFFFIYMYPTTTIPIRTKILVPGEEYVFSAVIANGPKAVV